MKIIDGGVCAAKGFQAGGIRCGVKESRETDDTAVIYSECECAAAAVYTMNRVKAAPLYVTMEHLENGVAQAIIANAGNANACAPDSAENARRMARAAARLLDVAEEDVVVASTGVIGARLNIECIEKNLPKLVLSKDASGSERANRAVMTTDTCPKTAAVEFQIGGKTCRIGGICKGSGMIHPNMGTMLAFLTTDCAITHEMLTDALQETVRKTYNRVTIDGDTSTNDMCVVLANGLADNELIEWQNEEYQTFCRALHEVNTRLARQIAADGEGASRLISCTVRNSRSEEAAERLAKTVVGSSLVKAAMFGADANWGRVLCAMGYSKAPFRPEYVSITFESAAGSVKVCEKGAGLSFDEELAKKVLSEKEVCILVDVNEGTSCATAWGCDLTYDYVKINGAYRT